MGPGRACSSLACPWSSCLDVDCSSVVAGKFMVQGRGGRRAARTGSLCSRSVIIGSSSGRSVGARGCDVGMEAFASIRRKAASRQRPFAVLQDWSCAELGSRGLRRSMRSSAREVVGVPWTVCL